MSYYPNNANGQAANANSAPVTLSTEQQAQLEDIKTSVQLLDNAIAGSEMQVDIVAPLPAGTNAIGKLSANSGVDIGDVDVTSLPALPTGTNSIGQVTANAGTNLNTSALATEATLGSVNTLLGFIESHDSSINSNTGDTVVRLGDVTETAPATDTASSGLNGRLQRIAQRLTSILTRTTIDQDYRSDSTTMTTTALQSLTSSATVGWQSDRVEITTELDVLIMVSLNPESTAPGGSRAAYVYLIPWYYDGTTWYASTLGTTTLPTGTQGTCTIASPNNLKLLGVLMYTATNQDMQDSFLISNAFGGRLPDGWSLEITNDTGSALRSADNVVKYKKINQQTV